TPRRLGPHDWLGTLLCDAAVGVDSHQVVGGQRGDRTAVFPGFVQYTGDQCRADKWAGGVVNQHRVDAAVVDATGEAAQCAELGFLPRLTAVDDLHRSVHLAIQHPVDEIAVLRAGDQHDDPDLRNPGE